jgi:pyrimidine operon attenuation protein / uracil phosphoribosyltransferase
MSEQNVVLDDAELNRALTRISHEILERNTDPSEVAIVGIHSRGAVLARRLVGLLNEFSGAEIPLGLIDIGFYRDDLGQRPEAPQVYSTEIDFPLDGATVVIVDDVLYSGRTVRAAIEALFAYGRPACVQLAVLVDRGHRELPIRPDYIGKNLPTAPGERVFVQVEETDGVDRVVIGDAESVVTGDAA